jgi:hypothetical protein
MTALEVISTREMDTSLIAQTASAIRSPSQEALWPIACLEDAWPGGA